MKIQVILASTRPNRVGERVAKWVTAVASEREDFDVELIDMAHYDLPHFDEPVSPRYNPARKMNPVAERWAHKLAQADGYVIVTPEYNHSIPGILKDGFDYLDFQIAKKPVAIVSYGTVGGARAAEQLKLVLVEAKAAVVPEAVTIMAPQSIIDEHGVFVGDASNPYGPHGALQHTLGELAWWTQTLRAGRQELVTA